LETGKVPSDWNHANVTPVLKKGDKHNPGNYRPISITCIACKLLEHIFASNMMQHLETNNILYELQHGFRAKRSCESQIISLIHELSQNPPESEYFFQQHWESEYLFRKKTITPPPFKLNGRSQSVVKLARSYFCFLLPSAIIYFVYVLQLSDIFYLYVLTVLIVLYLLYVFCAKRLLHRYHVIFFLLQYFLNYLISSVLSVSYMY
jgi:hypothetical protein